MMRLLKGIWRVLSGISRVITVLVPLVFVGIFVVAVSSGLNDSAPESLPQKAGLFIAPNGPLVEDAPPVEPVPRDQREGVRLLSGAAQADGERPPRAGEAG